MRELEIFLSISELWFPSNSNAFETETGSGLRTKTMSEFWNKHHFFKMCYQKDLTNLFRLFTLSEISQLRSLKLWDVIVNATGVKPGEVIQQQSWNKQHRHSHFSLQQIQKDVFYHRSGDPCPQPKQLRASDMPKCDYLKGHDSFQVRLLKTLDRYCNTVCNVT